jgi:hypothetical protein
MWTVIAAIAVSGFLGILTDWLFMGVLFHDAYNRYPEVWRPGVREGARGAIIWSSVLGFVISAGVVALVAVAGAGALWSGLGVAFLAWLAGPLPLLLINHLFVKIDAKITVSHCLGTLARMLIAGAAAGLILPLA